MSSFMAYHSIWRLWRASTPTLIRRLLKPHHPLPAIAHKYEPRPDQIRTGPKADRWERPDQAMTSQ